MAEQLDSSIPEPTRSLVHAARMALVVLRHPRLATPEDRAAVHKALADALDRVEQQYAGGGDSNE